MDWRNPCRVRDNEFVQWLHRCVIVIHNTIYLFHDSISSLCLLWELFDITNKFNPTECSRNETSCVIFVNAWKIHFNQKQFSSCVNKVGEENSHHRKNVKSVLSLKLLLTKQKCNTLTPPTIPRSFKLKLGMPSSTPPRNATTHQQPFVTLSQYYRNLHPTTPFMCFARYFSICFCVFS